jgi:alpha-mannosidase
MNRFDCELKILPRKPRIRAKERAGRILFRTKDLDVTVNARTGLVDRFRIQGEDFVRKGAFKPVVMMDTADAWGGSAVRFRKPAGRFRLMSRKEAARFAGIDLGMLKPVRVIEDGEARSVIEALFKYKDSFVCQRYKLPKRGTEIEVEVRVHWNEKNRMLKLTIPTPFEDGTYLGQVAFGVSELPTNGNEAVAQKWVAVLSRKRRLAFTSINDCVYGSDFLKGLLRISLLRSPAYSGLTLEERPIVAQDRFTERMDQGEQIFHFWFNGGPAAQRLKRIDREALVRNEKPFALPFFPSGAGKKAKPLVLLSDDVIQLSAVKKAEDNSNLVIRLFEPTGRKRTSVMTIPSARIRKKITLAGFEVKTFRINMRKRTVLEADCMGRLYHGNVRPQRV